MTYLSSSSQMASKSFPDSMSFMSLIKRIRIVRWDLGWQIKVESRSREPSLDVAIRTKGVLGFAASVEGADEKTTRQNLQAASPKQIKESAFFLSARCSSRDGRDRWTHNCEGARSRCPAAHCSSPFSPKGRLRRRLSPSTRPAGLCATSLTKLRMGWESLVILLLDIFRIVALGPEHKLRARYLVGGQARVADRSR